MTVRRVTTPLLLLAVLLSAGAAYAALLKYAETRLIVVGMYTEYSLRMLHISQEMFDVMDYLM